MTKKARDRRVRLRKKIRNGAAFVVMSVPWTYTMLMQQFPTPTNDLMIDIDDIARPLLSYNQILKMERLVSAFKNK